AVPAIRGLAAGAPAPAPSPVVLRVVLEPGDFEISNQKTLAVVKGYTGRMKVQVWNFGDTAKTGTVEVAGAALAGLPAEPIALGPRGSPPAEFECVLGPEDRSDRSNQISSTLVLWFAGNGERSSRLSMPLLFERRFLDTCDRADLSWRDPALWRRNSSATRDAVVFDGAEQALRFDGEWDDASIDRWMYPELPLATPSNAIASLAGARRFAFEVKSVQDKVENDFKVANVMLVFDDGTASDIYLWFAPPTGQWEKRYAEIPEDIDLGRVRAIRHGANPMGQRCTLWLRNLEILKPAPESCGIEDEKAE
ncbi:MAG: hypothetical protein IJS46_04990, partial [Kiritimatiellae bacterium]|nr:hypothetical protein [Kiritimatiellia bacterium]